MKVFGIGLQRTGLTSLTTALNQLGIKSIQCPKELFQDIEHGIIREYDGFTDNPVQLLYKELDKKYPNSKFIFTLRDEASWLKSIEWLFTIGAVKFKKAKELFSEFHLQFYGTLEFEEKSFRDKFRIYNQGVLDYFMGRPEDLLTINIQKGDGFEKLCPFLGKPVPHEECFPHRNKHEGAWKAYGRKLFGVARRKTRTLLEQE